MPRAKPTLGYPTRTAACIALHDVEGLTVPQVAARIGIKEHTVYALLAEARRQKKRSECRTVVFPVTLLDALAPYADGRGCSVNEIARRICEAAIDDKIVDAILDDAEDGK